MANRLRGLRGHERRFSDMGACSHPSAESLIGRLDELDIRLRQLEEKQQAPESYFSADLRRTAATRFAEQQHQCKPLASSLDNGCLKGTLMDRLHLLETRIQQLSSELDKGGNNSGSSDSIPRVNENENESVQTVRPEKNKGNKNALSSTRIVGGSWRAGEMYPKSKKKDSKEVIDSTERRASVMRRNEKRRMERTRLYKKWFPVGC